MLVKGEMLLRLVDQMLVWVVEELDKGIVAGSLGFLESSWTTSHAVSHSRSMLEMSVW